MDTTKRLTLDMIDPRDNEAIRQFERQMFEEAMVRIRAEGEELRRLGLMDEHGKMLLKELPPDMREGSDRDFGG